MAFNLEPIVENAATLTFELLGTTATLHKTSGTDRTFDPLTNDFTTPASADITVTITPPSGFTDEEIDGTAILSGDAKLLIKGKAGLRVVAGETLTLTLDGGNITYHIVAAKPVTAKTKIALWKVHLRR